MIQKSAEQLREQIKAVEKMKDDLRDQQKMQMNQIQLAIESEARNQNKQLYSQVNDVVAPQLKALDEHLKSVADKVSAITLA